MTQEEALQKTTILLSIIEDSIAEFKQLNTDHNLNLSLGDNEAIYDVATDIAYDQNWSTSNC